LYPPGAVGDPTQQLHDFEPGIAPSGLFWTIPIAHSAIDVDPGERAGAPARRQHSGNRLPQLLHRGWPQPTTTVAAPVVREPRRPLGEYWDRQEIRDETFGFTGHYVNGNAHDQLRGV
jgi:hypothetical protein